LPRRAAPRGAHRRGNQLVRASARTATALRSLFQAAPGRALGGIRPGARPVTNKKECSMKGDPQVIVHLQAQLKNELTATNQYFVHYRILKHWGFEKLANKEYEESIGEMKHADRLMERILMLDGLPNLQDLGKLMVGENVPEILDCDLRSERGAQAAIKAGIAQCETAQDYASREILEHILVDTEEHIDFLETQLDLLAKVGLQNYLQSQMAEAS